ncbi:hypothetical protein [Streptomyces sp. NPDC059761]|uniref:hypothetical protein n=1 Tax=Streptomyces sp. NPDC059761 TaxID=3346937 RepID=UPI00365082A6
MPAAGRLGLAGLASLLILQFWSARYRPWLYGSAIVMVSVVGTMAADVVHIIADIAYTVSARGFTQPLGTSFADWMGVPATSDGFGWGTGPVGPALPVPIAALVGCLRVSRADRPVPSDPAGQPG